MKPIAMLIGGTGFVGRHMQEALRLVYEVVATGRNVDIRDERQIDGLISASPPQGVINLAASTTVRETVEDPLDTYRTGFLGTLSLLNSLKNSGFSGTFLNISSSEIYGYPVAKLLPITEDPPLRPMSPYAVNKIAVQALCYRWTRASAFRVGTARPFSLIRPRQSDRFAIAKFSKQIAQPGCGKRAPVLHVRSLHAATRDIPDAREVVAYPPLLEAGETGEVYNVCTGTEISIRALLGALIGLAKIDVRIEIDPTVSRASEQSRIQGSFEKLRSHTGWAPRIPTYQTAWSDQPDSRFSIAMLMSKCGRHLHRTPSVAGF